MMRLFRKIRKQLAAENKIAKYSRYAIGEILLVVIGILIAVQINNLNESRKAKAKELVILKNLHKAIEGDIDRYENQLEQRLDEKKRGIDSLFNYIYRKKELEDSLFVSFYLDMDKDIAFTYDNGVFEALKSAGLELIQNDSLRSALNNVYTVELPRQLLIEAKQSEGFDRDVQRTRRVLSLNPVKHENGRKHFHILPKANDIIQTEDFHWILHMEIEKHTNYEGRIQNIKSMLYDLKNMIEKELKV